MDEKRFKLIFWPCNSYQQISEEFEAKAEEIVENLLQMLENQNFLISRDSDPQKLGQEELDARIECQLKITGGNAANSQLMNAIHNAMAFLQARAEAARHEFACALVFNTNTKQFFNTSFNPAISEIPTKNFTFLNLLNRSQPVVHRRVFCTDKESPKQIMDRYYNKPVACPMLTDFEHDRRQLIVHFPYRESQQYQNKENTDARDHVVSLIVRYSQIKRIMAKPIYDGHKKQYNLELFFQLSCPPMFRRFTFNNRFQNPVNLVNARADRWAPSWKNNKFNRHLGMEISESPIFSLFLIGLSIEQQCQLLNRLSMTTERPIEFRTFTEEKMLPFSAYDKHFLFELGKICGDSYALMYMIEAILSRGAIVKDHLLVDGNGFGEFVKRCADDFKRNKDLTLEVLEQTLAEIDKRLDCVHPMLLYDWIYQRLCKDADAKHQIQEDLIREGYVRVRKVIITPSRMLLFAPELLMGNRVLRLDNEKYPLEKFLRIVFRDDDMQQVYQGNVGDKLIGLFIGNKLTDGIVVAGKTFNYFGSSNSQMRDNGCYFMQATFEDMEKIRQYLGSFLIQSAPKMMSRIAQCFTQARETELQLDRKQYATVHDYEGGSDSNGDPYTFSDGVGRISMKTAMQLGKEMGFDRCVPSCYQFRFRGYKGVLALDDSLDRLREWGLLNGVEDKTEEENRKKMKKMAKKKSNKTGAKKCDHWLDLAIQFRPSQKKFRAPENQKLEIVKFSQPVPISLNRPVINILDQVSALQSQTSHERICNRIHQLMDIQLHSLTRSLIDETKARNKLGEFPKLILYDQLTNLNLTTEPFFRSMVRAAVRSSLRKLRRKLQIPIPASLGRAMFGIVDESGQLQYGQVYIQYTRNVAVKLPGPHADREVLEGPVMISKNPSIVAGDMRMFTAVDIPALHYLCDVVVFPRYGPRPHTDEMAGSDLDGDEYTVIWDHQLFLDHNEEAFDYTCKNKDDETVSEEALRKKMAEFFVNYIKQDSIGRIANAFLVNSDLFGIKSDICMRIANKHMEAVDFPKTGKPPEMMTFRWTEPEQPGQPMIPPERAERAPDYMDKSHEPCYVSTRLNGQLYRRAKEIDDILAVSMECDGIGAVVADPLFTWPGCDGDEFMEMAQMHYDSYAANIQSILDTYGIKSEGELFSGHYAVMRTRLGDKDADDMSYYNTLSAIEQQLFSVFGRFRRQFFETSLCGKQYSYEEITVPVGRFSKLNGLKDVFRRICSDPTEAHKKLACAYYQISYGSEKPHLLSFPWLAWDVLNNVHRSNTLKFHAEHRFLFDPISEKISEHMEEYITQKIEKFNNFKQYILHPERASSDEEAAYSVIKNYCERYKGLDKLLFYCVEWAKLWNLLLDGRGEGTLVQLHICCLLIQYGLNHLPCEAIESCPGWLEMFDENVEFAQGHINLEHQHGGIGKKFLQFLEFLSSRQFQLLPYIDFSEPGIGFQSVLGHSHLEPVHKAAIQVYHQLAFTFCFENLPSTPEQLRNITGPAANPHQMREGEPFVIEVPAKRQNDIICSQDLECKLKKYTGCTNIVFRAMSKYRPDQESVRIFVSSTGTLQSLQKLRELFSVRVPSNLNGDCRQIFTQMAEQLYNRLISL